MLRNIYFAGPDGSRKTTLANEASRFLFYQGYESIVFHFPTIVSPAGLIIELASQPRGKDLIADEALDFLFATDRLDAAAHRLRMIRERDRSMIFIFDRGPLDGGVYAVARDRLRARPLGWTLADMERIESKFIQMFPVDLGFLCATTVEEAQSGMRERGRMDTADRNVELQATAMRLFQEAISGRPEWMTIKVNRFPEEASELQAERLARSIQIPIRGALAAGSS
jgi:thymidylate kinase